MPRRERTRGGTHPPLARCKLVSEAPQSVPKAEASGSLAPAARWDRATGVVGFDWAAIEQLAAQGGSNQGMAKLLVAARAEGAGSRWPF